MDFAEEDQLVKRNFIKLSPTLKINQMKFIANIYISDKVKIKVVKDFVKRFQNDFSVVKRDYTVSVFATEYIGQSFLNKIKKK